MMAPQAPQLQSGPSAWGGAGLPEKRPVLPDTCPIPVTACAMSHACAQPGCRAVGHGIRRMPGNAAEVA